MRIIIKFNLLIVLAVFCLSCKEKAKIDEKPSPEITSTDSMQEDEAAWKNAPLAEPPPPLDVQLLEIAQKVENAWKELEELDTKKYAAVGQIVQEFRKIKGINKALLDSVETLQKTSISLRYTNTNLNDTSVLIKYDRNVEILMDKLDRLEVTSKYLDKCRKCMDIFEEIRQMDSQDLGRRIHFMSVAKDLNEMLEKEKAAIAKMTDKHKNIKKVLNFPHN
jgi:hypothetical protein